MNAVLEKSKYKANIQSAQGDDEFGPEADPRIPPNKRKTIHKTCIGSY